MPGPNEGKQQENGNHNPENDKTRTMDMSTDCFISRKFPSAILVASFFAFFEALGSSSGTITPLLIYP